MAKYMKKSKGKNSTDAGAVKGGCMGKGVVAGCHHKPTNAKAGASKKTGK